MSLGRCMFGDSLSNAMRLLWHLGGNAIQYSLGSPDNWTVRKIQEEDAKVVRKMQKKYGYYVVIHGKYLYNFCRTDSISRQITMLVAELTEAAKVRADVIIHQGKNVQSLEHTVALQNYINNIVQVLDLTPTLTNKIILENSACQGTEVGYSIGDLEWIYLNIPETYRSRIGFCIDLCHIFVSGELDVRDTRATISWLDRFREFAPINLVHFNDSAIDFGGCNDNHANIGGGFIGVEGLSNVAKYCAANNIPMILETPTLSAKSDGCLEPELQLVRSWI